MPSAEISVEVAFALPETQFLTTVRVPDGSDVEAAIGASGVYARFPEEDLVGCPVGIWGRAVARNRALRDGDRVELYRPLRVDPREARRERAASE